jgi:hypothetical protein
MLKNQKKNISHTPKGDSKVNKAKIAITNPAAKPLIRGSNFFDIFHFNNFLNYVIYNYVR